MTNNIRRVTASWVPSVTPTYVECPHGVRILHGTCMNDQAPTGEHPLCLAEYETAMVQELDDWYDEQWRTYRDMTGM